MRNAKWVGQLTIGMLLSTAGFADETKSSGTDAGQQPARTITVESLLEKSAYALRLPLYHAAEARPYANDGRRPIADVEFQDNSALGRISKLRNLSLLTLGESQRTRFFLGVNDDGLLGLHFIAVPGSGDRRYLSLARMPYLKKDQSDSRFE